MIRSLASGKWLSRILYWIVVAALFALAAWQRFSLPLDPTADPDTWGYLSPALEKLTGGAFIHNGRNFLYPGFLFLLLRLFGDFRAITITQHLLGLGAGGLLLLTWQRTGVFIGETRRTGVWNVPRRLRLLSLMSDTRLDLTLAQLPRGEVEIEVAAMMTSVRIVVPPGMRIANELSAIMSSVTSDLDDAAPLPNAPVLRLTGLAFMCEVRVVVRSRGALTGVSE